MTTACVSRNNRKMGTSGVTDSRTPRRFISVRTATAPTAKETFQACHDRGRTLKTASTPLAIEMAMVSA
jgi:hypothetical protein